MLEYWIEELEFWLWANLRVQEHLLALDLEHTQESRWLAHIVAAEALWLARVEDGSSEGYEAWPDLPLDDCAAQAHVNHRSWTNLLKNIPFDGFIQRIHYINTNRQSLYFGQAFETPLIDILRQLGHHGSYHRGQINTRLRAETKPTINVDAITWARQRDRQL